MLADLHQTGPVATGTGVLLDGVLFEELLELGLPEQELPQVICTQTPPPTRKTNTTLHTASAQIRQNSAKILKENKTWRERETWRERWRDGERDGG